MDDATSTDDITLNLPDATLAMLTNDASVALCAMLIPAIKAKMSEIQDGQILAVAVDDPTAREDLASWCRLTGHEFLQAVEIAPHRWRIYVRK